MAPLALAGEMLRARDGLLLELVGEDGASGWGEASPLPGFSREGIGNAARSLLALGPRALGLDLSGRGPDPAGLPPSVAFGFEAAWWSLRAAAEGLALPGVLDSRTRGSVGVAALLSGERVLEDAAQARGDGYRAVKLKVGGGTVEGDAALASGVAERVGNGVALRLDANRAWSLAEAERFVSLLDGVPFEYLEEPLARPEELAELVRRTGVSVALDESLVDREPEALGDLAYAGAVVLKPTMLGLSRTMGFAGEASRLGMTPVPSASYESGVGTAALVALAAAVGDAPAGLDTYRRLAGDVLESRLDLPAPVVDVERLFAAPLAVDRDALEMVGEGP